MFKEVDITEVKDNVVELLSKNWGLVTAGDGESLNTMTVSWGAIGELWGKPCATVYFRPQRYTEEFLNKKNYFTLSFCDEERKKDIHAVCGSKSGREVDKVKECGLTPCFDEKAPYFTEAKIVLVCRKMAKSKFDPKDFIDTSIAGKWYPDKDFHYIYYAEIEKVLISE